MTDNQAIIQLEDGWNDEIKPKALISNKPKAE